MAAVTADTLRAQLAEKSKQYESKIAALSAINSALQKENDKLRQQADREPLTDAEEELEELKEEFRVRLAQADRNVATLQEEKSRLSAALAAAQVGGSASEARLQELQATIDTLEAEGDKLSKKSGDLEAAARKLRAANKDLESERDKLQSRVKLIEGQLLELQAKADADALAATQQVEALEQELSQSQLDCKRLVSEARQEAADALARAEAEAARGGAEVVAAAREREAALISQVSELREAMTAMSSEAADKEDLHRRQLQRLEERVRQLETEASDMTVSAGDTSQPLLKQIERMAREAAASAEAARQAEQVLQDRLHAVEQELAAAVSAERTLASRAAALEAALSSAREANVATASTVAELQGRLAAEQRGARALEAEKAAAEERLEAALAREQKTLAAKDALKREMSEKLWDLEQQVRTLTVERDELLQRVEAWGHDGPVQAGASRTASLMATPQKPTSDPALGLARSPSRLPSVVDGSWQPGGGASRSASLSGVGGGVAGPDAAADSAMNELDQLLQGFTDAASMVAEEAKARQSGGGLLSSFMRGPAPASRVDAVALVRMVELLQQRLRVAERARDEASEQLYTAMSQANATQQDIKEAQALKKSWAELAGRCDMAMELLGERNERIEQLEEDIRDMKAIFHSQLEQCVEQLAQAQAELQRLQQHTGNGMVGEHEAGSETVSEARRSQSLGLSGRAAGTPAGSASRSTGKAGRHKD